MPTHDNFTLQLNHLGLAIKEQKTMNGRQAEYTPNVSLVILPRLFSLVVFFLSGDTGNVIGTPVSSLHLAPVRSLLHSELYHRNESMVN